MDDLITATWWICAATGGIVWLSLLLLAVIVLGEIAMAKMRQWRMRRRVE